MENEEKKEEITEDIKNSEEHQKSLFLNGKKKEDDRKENILLIKKKESTDIVDALRVVAPGTQLREGIDEIVRARLGALIVVDSENLNEIIEGGFKLNCKFTPQRLFELCKMDGAIILSRDLKKIVYSNCLLVPTPLIPTKETGTRHKAGERTAKQAKTLVIAISERRNRITLYYNDIKYSLQRTEEIFNKAIEKLQVLDKQREIYNSLISHLNVLEFSGLASSNDVASVIQRIEIINRINEAVKRNILELGNEGNLIKIRLKELTKDIDKEKKLILKDYADRRLSEKYIKDISKINWDNLLDVSKIENIIFENNEEYVKPKGYRMLDKIDIESEDINLIVNKLASLNDIMGLDKEGLRKIFGADDKADNFAKELEKLKGSLI